MPSRRNPHAWREPTSSLRIRAPPTSSTTGGTPPFAPGYPRPLNTTDVGRPPPYPALEPPIEALVIYNHNPLIVHPDQNRLRKGLPRGGLVVGGWRPGGTGGPRG